MLRAVFLFLSIASIYCLKIYFFEGPAARSTCLPRTFLIREVVASLRVLRPKWDVFEGMQVLARPRAKEPRTTVLPLFPHLRYRIAKNLKRFKFLDLSVAMSVTYRVEHLILSKILLDNVLHESTSRIEAYVDLMKIVSWSNSTTDVSRWIVVTFSGFPQVEQKKSLFQMPSFRVRLAVLGCMACSPSPTFDCTD